MHQAILTLQRTEVLSRPQKSPAALQQDSEDRGNCTVLPVSRELTIDQGEGRVLTPLSELRSREFGGRIGLGKGKGGGEEAAASPMPMSKALEIDITPYNQRKKPQSRPMSRCKRRILELTDLPGVLIHPAHAPVRSVYTQTPNNSSISPVPDSAFEDLSDFPATPADLQSNSFSPYGHLPAGDMLVEDHSLQSLFGAEINQPRHWRKRLDSLPARLVGQRSTNRLRKGPESRFHRVKSSRRPLSVLKNPKRSRSGESSLGRLESPESHRSRSPHSLALNSNRSGMRLPARVIMMRNLPNRAQLPRLRPKARW